MNRHTAQFLRIVGERIAESNHNVRLRALDVCGKFGRSLELAKRKRVVKIVAEKMYIAIGDKKKQITEAAMKALLEWISDEKSRPVHLSVLLPSVPGAFERPNARLSVLKFLETHLGNLNTPSSDDISAAKHLVSCCVDCLKDRLHPVREAGSVVLKQTVTLLRRGGVSLEDCRHIVDTACRDVKPATMREMSHYLKDALKFDSDQVEKKKEEEKVVVPVEKKKDEIVKKKTNKKSEKKNKKTTSQKEVVVLKEEEEVKSFWKTFTERSWANDRAKRKHRADMGKQRWTVGVDPTLEVPQKEIDWLHRELSKYITESCVENLFNSSKVQKQIQGMKDLEKNVLTGSFFENLSSGSEGGHAPANLVMDLLLKWCSYRLSLQPHPQATNQLLKTIGSICDVAEKTSNRLEDFEAESILPSLIERGFGNSKPRVRTQFRSLLRRLCHLYPASKVAEAVLGGLQSKNTRTHSECLDELRRLVAESGSGWHVVGRKGVKQIAKNVKSSSGEIRNGALQV